MTVDEELNLLDEAVRRLKVEYDVYFGGGSKKPPADTEWRVHSLIKRYSDSQKMSFAQRFKYNTIVQRYAIYNSLWGQKLRIREEGYRRPQDELLAIQGLRTDREHEAAHALKEMERPGMAALASGEKETFKPFVMDCSDVDSEKEQIEALFNAMLDAKRRAGESAPSAKFDSFMCFVKLKTEQIKRDYKCHLVEYRVDLHDNRVQLKAKAKL